MAEEDTKWVPKTDTDIYRVLTLTGTKLGAKWMFWKGNWESNNEINWKKIEGFLTSVVIDEN